MLIDLATEILGSVRVFLGPRVAARARRQANAEDLEHRMRVIALELQTQNERRLSDNYPLGAPGRLRPHVQGRLAPCVLVSPISHAGGSADEVANTVNDQVRQVDTSGKYLQPVSGGFLTRNGQPSTIDGQIGAVEIAQREFDPGPSLVVYFEQTANSLSAHVLLSNLIRTTDGASWFTMPVARLSRDNLSFASWHRPGQHSSDLEWKEWPLAESDGMTPVTALGSAIAFFTLAITSVYWELQGVSWRLSAPELGHPLSRPFAHLLEHAEPAHDESALSVRIEEELAGLLSAHVEAELYELGDSEDIALFVPLDGRSVMFVIGTDYPRLPPEILHHVDGKVEHVKLDPSYWDPSRALVNLVEALQ